MWALINNAGIQINGEVELMPMFQCQAVHEVNLYGVIRVTKAFLPLVRMSAGTCLDFTLPHMQCNDKMHVCPIRMLISVGTCSFVTEFRSYRSDSVIVLIFF